MFRFTISDLGVFLGKSPVTIRAWERKGFIESLPRLGQNRALTCDDIRGVALTAYHGGRISDDRFQLVAEALTTLELIEQDKT